MAKNVINITKHHVSAGGWFFEPGSMVRDVEDEVIPDEVKQLASGPKAMLRIEDAAMPVVVADTEEPQPVPEPAPVPPPAPTGP